MWGDLKVGVKENMMDLELVYCLESEMVIVLLIQRLALQRFRCTYWNQNNFVLKYSMYNWLCLCPYEHGLSVNTCCKCHHLNQVVYRSRYYFQSIT